MNGVRVYLCPQCGLLVTIAAALTAPFARLWCSSCSGSELTEIRSPAGPYALVIVNHDWGTL